MMKRLLTFLSLMIIPTFCFGNKYDDVKYDDVKQYSTFKHLQEYSEIMKQQLPVIEERIRQIEPELVESYKDYTDIQKIVKYNNYLAEKTFNDYKDFFMWLMEQKSAESGREMKSEIHENGSEIYYWLDEGIMDSEQCNGHKLYKNKNNGRYEVNKMLRDEQKHTCLYPDGFEEYRIVIQDFGTPHLVVSIDDKSTNVRAVYDVALSVNSYSDDPNNISNSAILDISKVMYDYQEWHQWRNQLKQDIKDGMYKYVPKKKQDCNPTFGCKIIEAKDIEKWKSSIIPGSKVRSMTSDRSLIYSH